MDEFREADQGDRAGYAAMLVMFSLPFHYVFWLGLYQWIRYGPYVTPHAALILGGMGFAAFALGWFAWWLCASGAQPRQWQLPRPFLLGMAVLLVANAVYQSMHMEWLHAHGSLTLGVGAFLLARRRS